MSKNNKRIQTFTRTQMPKKVLKSRSKRNREYLARQTALRLKINNPSITPGVLASVDIVPCVHEHVIRLVSRDEFAGATDSVTPEIPTSSSTNMDISSSCMVPIPIKAEPDDLDELPDQNEANNDVENVVYYAPPGIDLSRVKLEPIDNGCVTILTADKSHDHVSYCLPPPGDHAYPKTVLCGVVKIEPSDSEDSNSSLDAPMLQRDTVFPSSTDIPVQSSNVPIISTPSKPISFPSVASSSVPTSNSVPSTPIFNNYLAPESSDNLTVQNDVPLSTKSIVEFLRDKVNYDMKIRERELELRQQQLTLDKERLELEKLYYALDKRERDAKLSMDLQNMKSVTDRQRTMLKMIKDLLKRALR